MKKGQNFQTWVDFDQSLAPAGNTKKKTFFLGRSFLLKFLSKLSSSVPEEASFSTLCSEVPKSSAVLQQEASS